MSENPAPEIIDPATDPLTSSPNQEPLFADLPPVDKPALEPPPTVNKKKKKREPKVAAGAASREPFEGGPPVDERPAAEVVDLDEARAKKAKATILVDPKEAAETLVEMIDGLAMGQAFARYGRIANPEKPSEPLVVAMVTTKEEKKKLVDALVLFLNAADVQLSPGANLALTFGMIYGFKAMMLEGALRSAR